MDRFKIGPRRLGGTWTLTEEHREGLRLEGAVSEDDLQLAVDTALNGWLAALARAGRRSAALTERDTLEAEDRSLGVALDNLSAEVEDAKLRRDEIAARLAEIEAECESKLPDPDAKDDILEGVSDD